MTKWEKIFVYHISDKRLITKVFLELQLNSKNKTDVLIQKLSKDLNKHFFKKDIQMVSRYMKSCSQSLLIREVQNKAHYLIEREMDSQRVM